MDFKKEIGRRIRRAREGLDLTLDQLSRDTGGLLSGSRISNYEQGLRYPGPEEILKLAGALGESAAYLMCLDSGGDVNEEEQKLLRNWRALPEKDRKDYARRIETVALMYREPLPDEKLHGWSLKDQKNTSKPAKSKR